MTRPVVDPEVLELAEVYVRQNGHALHVNVAFILADEEPPMASQGFTARESHVIQAHYAKYDPHNRAENDDALAQGTA